MLLAGLATSGRASVQLDATGGPVSGDDWYQKFELSGFDGITEMWVDWQSGDKFAPHAITNQPSALTDSGPLPPTWTQNYNTNVLDTDLDYSAAQGWLTVTPPFGFQVNFQSLNPTATSFLFAAYTATGGVRGSSVTFDTVTYNGTGWTITPTPGDPDLIFNPPGTVATSTIPEPASAMVWSLLAGCGIAIAKWRRKRAA
jgi:hypothetical protein